MAKAKPEVLLSQSSKGLATKFQKLYSYFGVADSTMLSSPEDVFCRKSKIPAGKQILLPVSMVHYQPAVIYQLQLGFAVLIIDIIVVSCWKATENLIWRPPNQKYFALSVVMSYQRNPKRLHWRLQMLPYQQRRSWCYLLSVDFTAWYGYHKSLGYAYFAAIILDILQIIN